MKRKLSKLVLAMATVALASALAVPALAFAASSFADVEGDEWFAADVEWVNEQGLMTGIGDGASFEPGLGNTRAMLVTSLHRLEGEPAPAASDARVPEGEWYADAANWALEAGVLKGYDDGELGLGDPLTREQTATFLHRYAGWKGYDLSAGEDANVLSYLDAGEVSGWSMASVQWACGEGLLRGYADADGELTGVLDPRGACTRAQTAAVLHRFFDNVVPEPEPEPSTPPVYVHTHSYGDWESNEDGTHSKSCGCDDAVTEDCVDTTEGEDGACDICRGAMVYEVSTPEELASLLTKGYENIHVKLTENIDLPITSLGSITSGSGEYKLGGEGTEAITIDLNGKTLNVTTTYWSALGAVNPDATITVKNGSMNSTGNSAGTWNAYDLRFSNCDWTFENVTFDKAVALDNAGKKTTFENVVINETHDYYALWITAEGQNVAIDGLTINSSGRGIKIDEEYVGEPQKVILSANNATFTTAKKAAILVKSEDGADITLGDNVDISGVTADSTHAVWVDEDAAEHASKVTVTGGSMIVEGSEEVADGLRKSGTTYYITKASGLSYFSAKALTGNNGTVETATIELMSSINMGGASFSAVIAQRGDSLTFNGNGHTISGVKFVSGENDNTTGQASMFYCYPNSTLTVSNLTLEGITSTADEDDTGYAAAVVGYCEGTVTLNDVDVVGASVTGAKSSGILAGHVSGSLTATDCDIAGTVTLSNYESGGHYAGKYVGTMAGNIALSDCSADVVLGGNLNAANIGDIYGRKVSGDLTIDGAVQKAAGTQDELNTAVASGDNVEIALGAGSYTVPANLSAGQEVTFVGNGEETVFDFTKANNAGGASITFENLKIQGKNENVMSGFGIQHTTGDIVYKNCTFDGAVTNEYYGSVKYIDCTFTGTGYITTYAVKSATFEGCTFDKADSRAILVYSHGDNPVVVKIDDCAFKAAAKATTWAGDWTAAVEVDTTNISTLGTKVSISNCTQDGNYSGIVRDKSAAGKANAVITVDGQSFADQA